MRHAFGWLATFQKVDGRAEATLWSFTGFSFLSGNAAFLDRKIQNRKKENQSRRVVMYPPSIRLDVSRTVLASTPDHQARMNLSFYILFFSFFFHFFSLYDVVYDISSDSFILFSVLWTDSTRVWLSLPIRSRPVFSGNPRWLFSAEFLLGVLPPDFSYTGRCGISSWQESCLRRAVLQWDRLNSPDDSNSGTNCTNSSSRQAHFNDAG